MITENISTLISLHFPFLKHISNVASFDSAAPNFSAIQPPSDINFNLWSLGYNWKLSIRSPWQNYFTPFFTLFPVLGAANTRRPGISTLHRDRFLCVPIPTLVEWFEDSFLVPREIHVRPMLDSNQGHLDLLSNAPPLEQRANVPILNDREFYI